MYQNLEIFRLASAMAGHAAQRQSLVARNIAHADTPGYQAQDLLPFKQILHLGDAEPGLKATRTSHLHGASPTATPQVRTDPSAANEPNRNSVSLETEMVRAVEIKRHHDRAIAIYKSSMTILRSSLGRR
ncbi:FlgB family protein [Primorskyibacter aestuariivivens]|uniref:FlgB family protein n=1 Tax=Primorskyibacter aestuariivivens TaxID=1888912 RepID=UPI0022FFD01F|nr:FlgB family protein [Primorskyibacter aestuariivivens]MDA7430203.1 FlgB family protein [Primorskyibacter aestuariivivens]